MKGRWFLIVLAAALLLSGCSVFNQTYVHIEPHEKESGSNRTEAVSARDYDQLISALEDMVTYGSEGGLVYISDYDQAMVEQNMRSAEKYIRNDHPVGAYAVEDVDYEVGISSGKPAIAVTFQYRHSPMEIRMIRKVHTMGSVQLVVGSALMNYDNSLVLYVTSYEEVDLNQMVKDYVEQRPSLVMEMPQVTVGIFGKGDARVIELTFTYQNSRDSLRQMQEQVRPVFDSAALYVSGEGSQRQKYAQLFSFLMERFDYTLETSITPTYSLLHHGVGDSRAFAVVYAAMCRQAGLECMVVTGTRDGEPWNWNIVQDDGQYYHVDLIRSSQRGKYREYLDEDMSGYVWDYSAYPECTPTYVEPVTEPIETTATEVTEATEPETISEETIPAESLPAEASSEETTENLE